MIESRRGRVGKIGEPEECLGVVDRQALSQPGSPGSNGWPIAQLAVIVSMYGNEIPGMEELMRQLDESCGVMRH